MTDHENNLLRFAREVHDAATRAIERYVAGAECADYSRTATAVVRLPTECDDFERIGEPEGDLLHVEIMRYGTMIEVRFYAWPEVWRGIGGICMKDDFLLASKTFPSLCKDMLRGPGNLCYGDARPACYAWKRECDAEEAYTKIVMLLRKAYVKADAELVAVNNE